MARIVLACVLVLTLSAPLRAQRDAKIPDPDPELERRSFQVADGFEVNLYAADPRIAKPIQMNFDAAGRLWLASSEVYPQIAPGQVADDKILVIEDRDGDGRADSTTVFADGLLIPTGVEPGDGGAYVANSTELLHLKDTDGDGKADARRVVLSGFGTEDTHHILHTLRWGHDGLLYFNQSVYIHSHIETPHGVRRLGGGGIWQFRPESMQLGVFIRGLVNPWGHHVDRWGQHFGTDGAGSEGINYLVPGASYMWAVGASRVLPGLNPGSPKYCGLEVVDGRHLPDDWQGDLLTNDFRANRVCRFKLGDDGSGFAAREQPELIKTTHAAFRPIDVKMGPDGAIYIADWYNPIIQHGEVDFRDPRRDHTRGRIWRVTARGRPLVERPKLAGASIEDLLESLKAPEGWTRQFALRMLKERGAEEVRPKLDAWVSHLDPKDPEITHQRLEALWAYQALDVVEPDLLATLLRAEDFRARAAAVKVVNAWRDRLNDPLALLADRVADDHPRVRLEAVRALAEVPEPRSAALALRALDRPMDRFLDYGLWLAARDLKDQWLPPLKAGTFHFADPRHLLFAAKAVESPEVVAPLLGALRSGSIPEALEGEALALAARVGGPREMGQVLGLATDERTPGPRRAALLESLMEATRRRKVRPEGDLERLGPWLSAEDPAVRDAALKAVGLWKVEGLRGALLAVGARARLADPTFAAWLDGLAALGGSACRDRLQTIAREAEPPARRSLAVVALSRMDPRAAADSMIGRLGDRPDPAEIESMVIALLQRKEGPSAWTSALKARESDVLPTDAAKVALRTARASGRADQSLIDALKRAGGIAAGPVVLSEEEKARMVEEVRAKGDPARGELVFRRRDLTCQNCHAIAGAGGLVGPGLESIGASAPVDYLIDSLLQPEKAVKEGYHALVVATDDGRVITGIKVREGDSELVLRDAEGRELAIPNGSIEDQKTGGSLMPDGLTETLTHEETLDLVRFLSELGKVGSFAVGKDRVARRWRVGVAPEGGPIASWEPRYSKVDGTLPLADLPAKVARTEIDVSTGGPVRLAWNAAEGLMMDLDGKAVEARPEIDLDLTPGRHTLTVAIDPGRRRDPLRCELRDVPGSAARAMFAVGP